MTDFAVAFGAHSETLQGLATQFGASEALQGALQRQAGQSQASEQRPASDKPPVTDKPKENEHPPPEKDPPERGQR